MPAAAERAKYDRLWYRISLTAQSQGEVGSLPDMPAPGELPTPWAVWTLIGLIRYRQRQLWVGDIISTRLSGDMGQVAMYGALGHPTARPQSGPVPGMPEWEYRFHGRGCCLTHRVTGEQIDVDFHGDNAESIDVYFYLEYLRSLRMPAEPEKRMIELHPSLEPIRLAFDELRELGLLLVSGTGGNVARFSSKVLTQSQAISDFCTAWHDKGRQPHLAALIGDWLAAEKTVDSGNAALITKRAEELRSQRLQRLTDEFEQGEAGLALMALSDVNAAILPELLAKSFRGAVSGTTSRAMDIVAARLDAANWCAEVYGLFQRLEPNKPPPHPYLWATCVHFLLRHGYRVEQVGEALPRAGGTEVGEAALLALEYAPALAVGLFRRALRSKIPANRCAAAAALALIDRPWSRREMLSVLHESNDQEMTAECRAGLEESRDPQARQAVQDWEQRNPHEPEIGRFITGAEMMLRQRGAWMAAEMDRLRERVASLAEREPPEQ